MKTLIVIWVAALLSGVGTIGYINSSVDQLIIKQADCFIQCPNVNVQPAVNTVQVTSTKPLQSANESSDIQPVLGYKALYWNTVNLQVR